MLFAFLQIIQFINLREISEEYSTQAHFNHTGLYKEWWQFPPSIRALPSSGIF